MPRATAANTQADAAVAIVSAVMLRAGMAVTLATQADTEDMAEVAMMALGLVDSADMVLASASLFPSMFVSSRLSGFIAAD